jgi:hypothetical protein
MKKDIERKRRRERRRRRRTRTVLPCVDVYGYHLMPSFYLRVQGPSSLLLKKKKQIFDFS